MEAGSLYASSRKQASHKTLGWELLQRHWLSQPGEKRLAGSQPPLGPLTRLQIPTCNAPQGPSARMKAKALSHVSVCVRRPVISPTLFSAAFHLGRHFVRDVIEPLSPADSVIEHFRDRPIGSQISEENSAFTRTEAGTATKLLWRERKKLRKTNKKGGLEDVNQ